MFNQNIGEAPLPRIVIVDDEEPLALALSVFIEDLGYHTFVTGSSLSALTLTIKEHPALVIIDFMMPGMNGGELITAIRTHYQAAQLTAPALILMSAVRHTLLQNLPADDWLDKPFELEVVEQLLHKWVPLHH